MTKKVKTNPTYACLEPSKIKFLEVFPVSLPNLPIFSMDRLKNKMNLLWPISLKTNPGKPIFKIP